MLQASLWLVVIGGISTSLIRSSFAAVISPTVVLVLGMVPGALITSADPVVGARLVIRLVRGAAHVGVTLPLAISIVLPL